MSFGQVFFIKFVLHLHEWASGDKNLCSTLHSYYAIYFMYRYFRDFGLGEEIREGLILRGLTREIHKYKNHRENKPRIQYSILMYLYVKRGPELKKDFMCVSLFLFSFWFYLE